MDQATFAAKPSSMKALREKFVQKVAPAISKVGEGRLTPDLMRRCLDEAAKGSGFGRFVFGNNYWMLPGRGDAGMFYVVRIHRDFKDTSGYKPEILKFAKFSSVEAAVKAWCKSRGL